MQTEAGWQLDEQGARDYEANLVAAFMDGWARELLGRVGPAPGESVLDVGTGTGVVARRAAPLVGAGGEVHAVDINPAMLQVARELASDTVTPVSFRLAPAEDLPFDDESFDVVVAQQVLQFADARRALTEFRRVGRPAARLGVSTCRSLRHQPGYRVLAERVAEHLGAEAAHIIRSPYRLGDTDELVSLVTDAGFTRVETSVAVSTTRFRSARAFLQAETASSPLGDVTARLDPSTLGPLVADLERSLAPHTDSHGIVFPFETLTLTAVAS